ncbi:hypothetical protein [Erythrobacter sp. R86502]|uniref:hypothetical protein n=1 Tax=Erythrobacter sp. R86502 TaxID=3093846 RepID=UPI0036D38C9C
MLAFAIATLFVFAGIAAAVVVVDCLVKARAAYATLMREGEVMRAGLVLQAAARDMALRPSSRPITARRRPASLRPAMVQACAAA